jgi:hypothetical protein
MLGSTAFRDIASYIQEGAVLLAARALIHRLRGLKGIAAVTAFPPSHRSE